MEENPWKIIDSATIYENNWIKLDHYRVINPSGNQGIYGKVHFKNYAIGIIPLDENNNTWLVGQYRFPLEKYSWEIPEGGGDLQTDPLESAKRELLEETGIKAVQWNKIMDMHLSNSVSDELAFIYVARDLSFFDAKPEDTEILKIKKIPFSEAYQMALNGSITDSLSVAGILKTKILLDNGEI